MKVEQTDSTKSLMKELLAKGEWPEGENFIYAGYQTAGRGQTGNGWESEADKNLLCSILLPPKKNLFELNVAVSVAVLRTMKGYGLPVTEDIFAFSRPIQRASMVSATTCAVKALVDATPISGPTWV